MCDILWADPATGASQHIFGVKNKGWGASDRGTSFVFSEKIVEEFLKKINGLMSEEDHKKFKITDDMDYLYDGYFKRKDRYDVTKNIKEGKKDTSKKYV